MSRYETPIEPEALHPEAFKEHRKPQAFPEQVAVRPVDMETIGDANLQVESDSFQNYHSAKIFPRTYATC